MDRIDVDTTLFYLTLNIIGECKNIQELFNVVNGAKKTFDKLDEFLEEID